MVEHPYNVTKTAVRNETELRPLTYKKTMTYFFLRQLQSEREYESLLQKASK